MPIKPKYSLLLCFVLFSVLLSAQETAPLRKNHFGFGASWQTQPLDYDKGKGLGLKLRYERGKRGIRFLSEIGTERMRYTAFKSSGESSHDIGWGSHSWRKTESHDLLVYSNTFAIGSVLRTQNKKRFKVGIGLKFGYHQKMLRKFLSESCTMQYFRRRSWPVWQSSSFIESPIYECDAKKSVILKNTIFTSYELHLGWVFKNRSELDFIFDTVITGENLYTFKYLNSNDWENGSLRWSYTLVYVPNFTKKR